MDSLTVPLVSAWNQVSLPLLNLLAALIVILLGFLLARLGAFIVAYILKLARLDQWAKTVKFNQLLEKGEVKKGLSELLGDGVFWAIILLTVLAVGGLSGLKIEPVMTKVMIYLGLALMAALVLGLGLFFAAFFSGLVKVVLLNCGVPGGKALARFIYYVVVLFTFLAVLAQLGLKPGEILAKLDILLGTVGLAAAIAFGLGCKDMAADFLYGIFKGK
ncbi:MAG: hypothetical protein JW873_07370 [Candidatus Saganbacteria bacterium]|nr:hypothetical protein [Candidatus Saganbacteria bacterium]